MIKRLLLIQHGDSNTTTSSFSERGWTSFFLVSLGEYMCSGMTKQIAWHSPGKKKPQCFLPIHFSPSDALRFSSLYIQTYTATTLRSMWLTNTQEKRVVSIRCITLTFINAIEKRNCIYESIVSSLTENSSEILSSSSSFLLRTPSSHLFELCVCHHISIKRRRKYADTTERQYISVFLRLWFS